MNSIIIKGRLTHDPELKITNSDKYICKFCVAVNSGSNKEADFFNIISWDKTADFISKYFNKGQEILISGEMISKKYVDKDGNNRISWELLAKTAEFCGNKSKNIINSNNEDDLKSDLTF